MDVGSFLIDTLQGGLGNLAYSILSTPGLVINEKLVSSGRIPVPASVTAWIARMR